MPIVTAYQTLPISFKHGKGVWLYDSKGRAFLDSFSGIGVCGLGHAHPAITKTIQQQSAKLIHTSNVFIIEEQVKLAERLTTLTNTVQAFFSNSGAEANEAAIKLARLYGHKRGVESPAIVVMDGAFHGRTMATLTASGSRKVQAGFEPLVPGFIRAPFNDLDALSTIAEHRDDVVAVMVEPIQGEGGVITADKTYLQGLRKLCDKHHWLLIVDEVQTGNGRTGPLYAYMDFGIQPDVITTAKGLGNGMPISACLINHQGCDLFKPGNHGSTFGGNPLACATALTVLEILEKENLCDEVRKNSVILRQKLNDVFGKHPNVRDIRGKGYMIGIELDRAAAEVKQIGLKHGILINVTAESVIRLLPPLIMSLSEQDQMVSKLVNVLDEFI